MPEDTRTEEQKLIHFVNVLNESHARLTATGNEVDELVRSWESDEENDVFVTKLYNLQANIHGREEAQRHDAEALK